MSDKKTVVVYVLFLATVLCFAYMGFCIPITRVSVVGPYGDPMEDAVVVVENKKGKQLLIATTNKDGIVWVPSQNGLIWAAKDGYEPRAKMMYYVRTKYKIQLRLD